MLLTFSAALLATSANAPATPARNMPVLNPNAGAPKNCPATSRYEAARRGGTLPPSLLNQLPSADVYNAVYRRVGGCEAPIIVRYNVGGR